MTPQFLLWAVPILLFLTIFEVGVDFLRREKHFSLPDTLTNISCGIGNQGINLFTEGLKLFLFIDIFFHKLSITTIPHAWWSVLLGLLVLDFAFYWEHRFSHLVNILWGTHVVHHSSEEFNLSIALRRAWYADLVVLVFFLPIPMLGFQAETFLTAVIIHNFYQYIIHTRAVGKLPWMVEYILHTPSHHRVHHARDPKYIDKNFSGVFILYDRLFGTFKEEEEEPTYGITTPLQTNNPALVNLHYYADMARNMRQMRSWKDKLRYLFAPPGWFPEYMGGFKPAPPVDKEHFRKYTPKAYGPLGIYALVQFLSGLGGLLFLMLIKKYLNGSLTPGWYEGVFFGLIALASVIPIAAFDRQPWVRRAELLRLGLVWLAISAFVAIWHPEQALLTIAGITMLTIGMAMWFLRVWNRD
jgi:alkylglycerol monooxygenase